ncbi:hypothetical protein PoB_000475300, partial [Plakobranchus ocellatus]
MIVSEGRAKMSANKLAERETHAYSKSSVKVPLLTPAQTALFKDTECERHIETCVTGGDRNKLISFNIQTFQFKTACKYYKTGLDCLSNVFSSKPNCDSYSYSDAYLKAKDILFSATSGFCGLDGSISGCAYDFQNCMSYVDLIRNPLNNLDNNQTCRNFVIFSDCTRLIKNRMHCPTNLEVHLEKLEEQLEGKLKLDCFLTCDIAIDLCVSDITTEFVTAESDKNSEDYHEVLCAQLEKGMDCINATDVEELCENEKKRGRWREALNNQTSSYNKAYCSIPAKTCLAEMTSCIDNLNAQVAAKTVSTAKQTVHTCKELEKAVDCIKRTSLTDFCQEKTTAQLIATTLDAQREQIKLFCGVSQCHLTFPDCFDYISKMKLKVEDSPESLTCEDVELSLACSNAMIQFEPCLRLEVENMTFENSLAVLKAYKNFLCESDQTRKSECEKVFPKCYAALTQFEKRPTTC